MFLGGLAGFVRDVEGEVDLAPLVEFGETASGGVHARQTDGAYPSLLLAPVVSCRGG